MKIKLDTPIDELNKINNNTLMQQLGIEYLKIGEGYVSAKMPVDERTKQPMGILHGGANLALAETIGGLGSAILVDLEKFEVRGAQLSANHIGAVSSGWVYGEATIIHKGKNTHLWNIDVKDDTGRKVFSCRLTNFVLKK